MARQCFVSIHCCFREKGVNCQKVCYQSVWTRITCGCDRTRARNNHDDDDHSANRKGSCFVEQPTTTTTITITTTTSRREVLLNFVVSNNTKTTIIDWELVFTFPKPEGTGAMHGKLRCWFTQAVWHGPFFLVINNKSCYQ